MYSSLSRRLSSSLIPPLTRCTGQFTSLRSFSNFGITPGSQENFQRDVNTSENDGMGRDQVSEFPARNSRSMNFVRGAIEQDGRDDAMGRDQLSEFPARNSRSMNFVRGVIEQDGRNNRRFPQFQFQTRHIEQNADVVHIKMMRNNTFVTVTDSKGNKKLGASAGSVPEMKGGAKLSKYAAEATAEHVGRMSRNFGLKSVVIKVNGFTYFKKKKQAILSWKDGFTNSKVDQNPVIYIEDTTRKPHNGCRLRKKRRV